MDKAKHPPSEKVGGEDKSNALDFRGFAAPWPLVGPHAPEHFVGCSGSARLNSAQSQGWHAFSRFFKAGDEGQQLFGSAWGQQHCTAGQWRGHVGMIGLKGQLHPGVMHHQQAVLIVLCSANVWPLPQHLTQMTPRKLRIVQVLIARPAWPISSSSRSNRFQRTRRRGTPQGSRGPLCPLGPLAAHGLRAWPVLWQERPKCV